MSISRGERCSNCGHSIADDEEFEKVNRELEQERENEKVETELVLWGLEERAAETYNKDPQYGTVELRAEEVLALLKTISPALQDDSEDVAWSLMRDDLRMARDEVRQLKCDLSDAVTAVQQERDKQVSQLRYEFKVAREEVEALKAQNRP